MAVLQLTRHIAVLNAAFDTAGQHAWKDIYLRKWAHKILFEAGRKEKSIDKT